MAYYPIPVNGDWFYRDGQFTNHTLKGVQYKRKKPLSQAESGSSGFLVQG